MVKEPTTIEKIIEENARMSGQIEFLKELNARLADQKRVLETENAKLKKNIQATENLSKHSVNALRNENKALQASLEAERKAKNEAIKNFEALKEFNHRLSDQIKVLERAKQR